MKQLIVANSSISNNNSCLHPLHPHLVDSQMAGQISTNLASSTLSKRKLSMHWTDSKSVYK